MSCRFRICGAVAKKYYQEINALNTRYTIKIKSIETNAFYPFHFTFFPVIPGQDFMKKAGDNPALNFYTTPCASMASATFTKPAMFAPFT